MNFDTDQDDENVIDELQERIGLTSRSATIRWCIHDTYVHKVLYPKAKRLVKELTETEDELADKKRRLKMAEKNGVEDTASLSEDISELTAQRDEQRDELDKVMEETDRWRMKEDVKGVSKSRCPVCSSRKSRMVDLAQHIYKKKDDSHDEWMERHGLNTVDEIKLWLIEQKGKKDDKGDYEA